MSASDRTISGAPVDPIARELFEALSAWPIYDPHSHIDAHRPAARDFDEILGYHYYTELAHSAGMPAEHVAPNLEPRQRARNLAAYLDRIDNTVQFSWLIEIARTKAALISFIEAALFAASSRS